MRKMIIPVALVLFFFLFLLHLQSQSSDNSTDITIGKIRRTYLLHVPPSFGKTGTRSLVVALHGGYGTASGMDRLTGFNRLSDREGFLVVYPNGINRHWNDGRETIKDGADDVAFISALIDRLTSQYAVDPRRVYATGISNGGFLSLRLACDLSEKTAAVASVAASMPEFRTKLCQPSQPISILIINGTEDPIVPYGGGTVKHRGNFGYGGEILSAPDSASWWAEKNTCDKIPTRDTLPDSDQRDGTTVVRTTYSNGQHGVEVTLLSVHGGGHTWPGGQQYLPALLIGKTSRDIDASAVIWKFFQQHQR